MPLPEASPPAMPEAGREVPAARWLVTAAVTSFVVLLGMWLALVGTVDVQDLIGGAASAAAAVGVGYLVGRQGRALPAFRRGDGRRLLGVVPHLCTETFQVYAETARRALGAGTPSRIRTVATDGAGGGWPGARRSAVNGALLSATPNTVLIDIDAGTGTATVHEMVARRGAS